MQLEGIPLLILAFTVLYFGLKLFSFVKALAFKYANNLMVGFYLFQYLQLPRDTYLSHITTASKFPFAKNSGDFSWDELFYLRKT